MSFGFRAYYRFRQVSLGFRVEFRVGGRVRGV